MTTLGAQTPTLANVASSTSSVALFAAVGSINGRSIFNDSTANLFVAFGSAAASTTNFTVKLAAGAFYEFREAGYAGPVQGIWDAANGNARVTSW